MTTVTKKYDSFESVYDDHDWLESHISVNKYHGGLWDFACMCSKPQLIYEYYFDKEEDATWFVVNRL